MNIQKMTPKNHPSQLELSEIAPGKFVTIPETPEAMVPRLALCTLKPIGDGKYELIPINPPGYAKLTQANIDALGFKGLTTNTLRRLMQAGFVEHIHPSPAIYMFSLAGLFAHVNRSRNAYLTEESWWSEERLTRWRETCGR